MPRECLVDYYMSSEGETRWKCPKSMGTPITGPTTRKYCWMYKCPGVKPLPEMTLCKTESCKNLRSSTHTLYCSPKCKSRESSRRYRLKRKNGTPPATQ
jgi:hypothetical protein